MTAANFAASYQRIRVYEGGNVDDPKDPGGRTSRGITQRVYDAYRSRQNQPARDVYKATDAEVKSIYRAQYWDAVQGDKLPAGVDLVLFDGAVNSGPKQSIKWLQAALGIPADGVIGGVTLKAVDDCGDLEALIEEIGVRRMGFLHKLKTFARFGKGWSARVANVTKAGQSMVSGATQVKLVQAPGAAPKAPVEDLKTPAVSAEAGTSMTAAGGALEGANEVVKGAASQVQAVSDTSEVLRYVFVALTVIGLLLTAYAFWRNNRSRKAVTGEARMAIPLDADEAPV